MGSGGKGTPTLRAYADMTARRGPGLRGVSGHVWSVAAGPCAPSSSSASEKHVARDPMKAQLQKKRKHGKKNRKNPVSRSRASCTSGDGRDSNARIGQLTVPPRAGAPARVHCMSSRARATVRVTTRGRSPQKPLGSETCGKQQQWTSDVPGSFFQSRNRNSEGAVSNRGLHETCYRVRGFFWLPGTTTCRFLRILTKAELESLPAL